MTTRRRERFGAGKFAGQHRVGERVRHQPESRNAPQWFTVSPRRDVPFGQCGLIACNDAQADPAQSGPGGAVP